MKLLGNIMLAIILMIAIWTYRLTYTGHSYIKNGYIKNTVDNTFNYATNTALVHTWLIIPNEGRLIIKKSNDKTDCKIIKPNLTKDCTISIYKEKNIVRTGLIYTIIYKNNQGQDMKYMAGMKLHAINGLTRIDFSSVLTTKKNQLIKYHNNRTQLNRASSISLKKLIHHLEN